MSDNQKIQAGGSPRPDHPGWRVLTVPHKTYRELFITALPQGGESTLALLTRLAAVLRDNHAHAMSIEIFALPRPSAAELQSWSAATGGDSWPLAWIAEQTEPVAGLGGILAWALAGVPVQPL
ncbi:MAG: hypothetical protein ABIG44_15575, partial [Planctomycetota bacterium]